MNQYYLAVPVGERLPAVPNDDQIQVESLVICESGEKNVATYDHENKKWNWFSEDEEEVKEGYITHWLEPTEGVLLQTEELKGLCKMAFNQGIANAVYGEGSKEYMSFENWIEENLTPAKQK